MIEQGGYYLSVGSVELEVEVVGERDRKVAGRCADGNAHCVGVAGGDAGWSSTGEGCGGDEGDGGGAVSSSDADELDGLHEVLLLRLEVVRGDHLVGGQVVRG